MDRPLFLTVDANDSRPVYQQIADGVKALIAGGHLREGAALPSVRQVAADLGVNFNTVATAYRQLQDDGLVTIRHGAGAVVADHSAREATSEVLRKGLRGALADLLLAGFGDREIVGAVREELQRLRAKGRVP
jgi:DNA-binding transcriptional regulator YhcF (GntR family)